MDRTPRWIAVAAALLIAAPAALLIAAPAAAADKAFEGRCADEAVAAVAKFGIARANITRITIDNIRNESFDASVLTDVVAWMTVTQCEKGSLIVQMTPECRVAQIYTWRGCSIPGIDGS